MRRCARNTKTAKQLLAALLICAVLPFFCPGCKSSPPAGNRNVSSADPQDPASEAPQGGAVSPGKGKILPVKNIQQLPELQSGCEITSAAIVLNYLKFNVSKMDLLKYMDISNDFKTINGRPYGPNPWKIFAGSPDSDRYGCYAPVICSMVNRYLLSVKSKRCAFDITGAAPTDLYSLLGEGVPVIIWATVGMEEPTLSQGWYLNDTGAYFKWVLREHCMVLIGYNGSQAVFSDPNDPRGTVAYDKALFEKRYGQLFSQAVVIQ